MATPNKDAAKEVYTPDHSTRTQSAIDSVPSLSTDGTDCSGFNVLAVTRKLLVATSVDYSLYFFDNKAWILVEDSTGLDLSDYDPTAPVFFQHYNISAVFRYKFVLTTVTGGTVEVTENLSV